MSDREDIITITLTRYREPHMKNFCIRKLGSDRFALDMIKNVSMILELWYLRRRIKEKI